MLEVCVTNKEFLVTYKILPAPPAMAKTAQALAEALIPWIEKEKKAGSIIEMGGYAEGNGGVAIVESESNDALYAKLIEAPFSPFMKYSVTPLVDIKLQIKAGIEFYKKMAEA